MKAIFVLVLLLATIGVVSADTILVNDIYVMNSTFDDIGGLATVNLSIVDYLFLNFTINASVDRIITNVSLNFTAYGANACALGNKQDAYCFNYYNTTNYKWVEFVNGTETDSFDDTHGTTGDFINETRNSDGQNMTVTYIIDEHYNPNIMKHYGVLFNFSDIKYQTDSNIRITKNNYIRVLSGHFVMDSGADIYRLDSRFDASTADDTDVLYSYMCNATYNETAGDPAVSNGCALICAEPKTHIIDGRFSCIFTSDFLTGLGDGRNVSVVFATGIPNQNRYFALKTYKLLNVTHGPIWQYSNDGGTTWVAPTDGYESQVNINYVYGDTNTTAFKYMLIATNNNSEVTTLEGNVTWDVNTSTNFQPLVSIVNPDNNETINLPYNVSYNVVDASDDPFNITLYLYNRDMSLNSTLFTGYNISNLSYYWDSSQANDDYILRISVCELNTTEKYCANDTQYLTIKDMDIILNFVIPLDANFSYVLGFNSSNLETIEYMLLNFTVTAVGNTKIENVSLNFTAFGNNSCALGNKQDDVCYNYYQNDTYKWIEFKNYTETTTFDPTELTVGDAIVQNATSDGQNMTITYLIDEHFNPNVIKAYEAWFNYSDLKWQNTSSTRLTKDNMIRVCAGDSYFPYDADQYRIDTRFNPSDSILDDDTIYGYVCNDTYNITLGDPALSSNCELACQKDARDLKDTEKFRCIFTSSIFNSIGQSRCIVLKTDIPNQNRYYSLRTFAVTNPAYNATVWEYSTDIGSTWVNLNDGYETELNMNWFYDGANDTAFIYNLKATNNESVVSYLEGNMTWDINPAENYPPAASISAPIGNETIWYPYNITFNIWDPNNDELNVTLGHVHYNGTYEVLATNMNSSNVSLLHDENITVGDASFILTVCELFTSDLFCVNSTVNITLVSEPPTIDSFTSNASNVYQGDVVLFTANITQTSLGLSKVWISIRGSVVNITDAVNGTNNLSYTASSFYGNYSVFLYVNDTLGNYNRTNSLYLNVNSLKGVVPEDAGSPFYTTTDNPYECGQLWEGQSCAVSFVVNSTGAAGFDYSFFAWVNTTENITNTSDNFYVSTIDAIPNSTGTMDYNDTLYCNITYGDVDGDSVSFVNSTIGWYQNHTLMKNGSLWLNCTENSSWCLRGMNVFCFACVEDEHGFIGGCNQSYSLTISNEPPVLAPYITPFSPDDGSNLVCVENATDPENDTLYYTYMWYINDSASNITSKTVGNVGTTTGESWICQVSVFDGSSTITANTSAVTIGGACPSIPVLLYPPNWSQVSGLPIEFDWSNSTVAVGSITYHIQTSNVSDFATLVTDISIIPSEYSSNDSYRPDTYYWRTRAYANSCYSNWSDVWIFSYVNGTCYDGIKNYHGGQQEVGVDCGGPCDACECASSYVTQMDMFVHVNGTGDAIYTSTNITLLEGFEMHCRDGCFEPQYAESDTDCGGFGQWACPACGVGQNCTSHYECDDGLFCKKDAINDTYGVCADNAQLSYCSNGLYNPTLNESDIDCGGPCDRCVNGDRCVSTLDCGDEFVCNQYDICVEQTDDIRRKRGRQLGAIAAQGLSMNQAFCAGVNDRYYQVPGNELYNWACPGDDAVEGVTSNPSRYTYVIDTTGLTAIWDDLRSIIGDTTDDRKPVLIYHIEEAVVTNSPIVGEPSTVLWRPLWHADDGQSFACDPNDGADGRTACYAVPVFSTNEEGPVCKLARYDWLIDNYLGSIEYCNDLINECDYHCDTLESSNVFKYSSSEFKSPDNKQIFNSGCLFIGLCKETRYRIVARVMYDDGSGEYTPYKAHSLDTSVVEFTTSSDDGGVIKPLLDAHNNKGVLGQTKVSSKDVCNMPAMWDVTRCDGEGVSDGVFDFNADEYFFASTGCSWYDTAKNRWRATTYCGMPYSGWEGTEDDRLKLYPLSDFGCDGDPTRIATALLDFSAMYEENFKPGSGSEYEYDRVEKLNAIHMLITRKGPNDQECLVYDNLLANAYKYQPELIGDYFNLYMGGAFVDRFDPRYGPRLKLPVCEEGEYTVLLYYIDDVTKNENPPGGYDSIQSYAADMIWGRVVTSGAIAIDFASGSIFDSFLDSIKDLFTDWDPDCRKPDTTVCLPRGKLDSIMSENPGAKHIHTETFTISRNARAAGQDVDVVSRLDDKDMCYADYRVSMGSELDSSDKSIDDTIGDARSKDSVSEWLFGGNDVEDTATIGETDAWITPFFRIFDPFDIRPPFGLKIDPETKELVFDFDLFFRTLIYTLFTDPFGFIILLFKLMLFYLVKFMFWVLLYALLTYLWTRAMPRVSVYWVLIIFLFIAIVVLGWWESYSDFIAMFKGI